jgi:inosine/xanthosine triphosphate pyrophosphatase family protein
MSAADELAKVRAERAAIAARRAQKAEEQSVLEELEKERLAFAAEQALEAAEKEHGPVGKNILAVHTSLGVVIVKRAPAPLFKRFQDQGTMKTQDLEKLVRPCVVFPDAASLDKILDMLPATLLRCANAVSVLAGVSTEEVSGKY